jgi:plastocyanin
MLPIWVWLVFVAASSVTAGTLEVTVTDLKGQPVADAVVYAQGSGTQLTRAPKQQIIDQQNKQFVPYVTAVQVGTAILFPNRDNIRHHVYSLSPAKKFELPLYTGIPAAPVVFDKEGFVTLGCNIHDWMIAYVAVVPTPYFKVTSADGRVRLTDLPPGKYTVEAWQPLLRRKPEELAQVIDLPSSVSKAMAFSMELRPDFRAHRAPDLGSGGYP